MDLDELFHMLSWNRDVKMQKKGGPNLRYRGKKHIPFK